MRRALQLARNGEGRVSPNPMVGAVIIHGTRIIGEGFHANYGGKHAEVNAIESVRPEDRHLLKDSQMYVTLEPCSHYGKTPPCANLLVKTGIPQVVIGTLDPNKLVAGRGVKILRDAGIEVSVGVLEKECQELNKRFMKAHSSDRPWIILKWAQSADGYIAAIGEDGLPQGVKFSTPVSSIWMHRERANVDAILVGENTEKLDNPQLTVRLWGGNSPRKYVATGRIDCKKFVEDLRKDGVTSLMVEGGAGILHSFINEGLYDEIRIETSPIKLCSGLKAPSIPDNMELATLEVTGDNIIEIFRR